jgi:hypothetical protein
MRKGEGLKKQPVELLPILLEGKTFTIDASGSFATNEDGKTVLLADQERSRSRFK